MTLVQGRGKLTHVVGIDPGGTTGFCGILLDSRGGPLRRRVRSGTVHVGQLDSRPSESIPWYVREARLQGDMARRLRQLASAWHVEDNFHLAIEDFVVRERTMDRSLLSPVRHTAGILALLDGMDDLRVVVHLNSASDAKSIVKDDTLKTHGLYHRGQPHSNDAGRHALLVLRKELS